MLGDQRRGDLARNLLRVRRARTASFPSALFDEYAWNMLLNLFVGLTENETISEADLIERSSVGVTIGRRWINHLVSDGQIEARHDGEDVALTADAIQNMRTFLDKAEEIHGTPAIT